MEINFQKKLNSQKIFAMFLITVMAGTLALPFNFAEGIEYYQRDWVQTTKTDFQAGLFDKTNVIAEYGLPIDNAAIVLDHEYYCSDGDLLVDGEHETASERIKEISGDKKYCTVKIINGGVLTFPTEEILTIHAYSIFIDDKQSSINRNWSSINGDEKGFSKRFPSQPGDGEDAERCWVHSDDWMAYCGQGGGGAGHGGIGGRGGDCTPESACGAGAGGSIIGSLGSESLYLGRGGGAGTKEIFMAGGVWGGGSGGRGGGAIFLDVVNIDIRGEISMKGGEGNLGEDLKGGSGGGGSGGSIVIKGRSINISGNLSVNGGAGGGSDSNGGGGGGGGGGGRIKIFYEMDFSGINHSIEGGSGGLGGAGNKDGHSGNTGTFYSKRIVYIPYVLISDDPAMSFLCIDGDLVIDGENPVASEREKEISGEKKYCTVEIVRGGTLTVPQGQTLTIHAHSIYIDEDSFVNVDGKGNGPGAGNGFGADGSDVFNSPYTVGGGGGGAGYNEIGGNGCDGRYTGAFGGSGGITYGVSNDELLEIGSGGGDGIVCNWGSSHTYGGGGGGAILFEAPNISILGSLSAKGSNGQDGKSYDFPGGLKEVGSGGGGGSGGTIIIKGGYPDLSRAVIDVSGGNGGKEGPPTMDFWDGEIFAGDGGGGSGGRVKIFYQGVLIEQGTTYIASGGDGGSGDHMGGSGGNGSIVRDYMSEPYVPTIPMSDSYFPSGTFASEVYKIPDYDEMASWDEIQWNASTELGVTDITMEVRASNTLFDRSDSLPAWTPIGSISPVIVGLPAGKYIQFRTSLSTSDGAKTPILHDATIIYTPVYDPIGDFNVYGWAWSDNIGWISFNYQDCYNNGDITTNPPGCPDVTMAGYGVHIDETSYEFSGHAWSENVGWISFDRAETGDPPADPYKDPLITYTAKLINLNEVSGWAKVLSNDNWIRLRDDSNDGPPLNVGDGDDVYIGISDSDFHNYAWSEGPIAGDGDDIGWISFNCLEGGAGMTDICGTSDYKVYTTLDFIGPPLVDIDADGSDGPITIVNGSSADLTWETTLDPLDELTPLDTCVASGNWLATGNKPKDSVAPESTGPLSYPGTYTYTLECTGLGGVGSDTVEIIVMKIVAKDLAHSSTFCGLSGGRSHIELSWVYENSEGSAQASYEIEIAADSSFSPIIQTISGSGINTTESVYVVPSPSAGNEIPYIGGTYYWRIKVEDEAGRESVWQTGASIGEFETPNRPYPNPNFTMDPASPTVGTPIQLCSNSSSAFCGDESTCYQAGSGDAISPPSCTGNRKEFEWIITNDLGSVSFVSLVPPAPNNKKSENPIVEFDSFLDDVSIVLEIRDKDINKGVGNCQGDGVGLPGCCRSSEQTLDVSLPLPEWQEISPSF